MMQSQQIPMTFQRYETKYMLSPIMARKLRKSLPGHLQMDEYGLDTICSLYYDTPDHQLIRRSLEKPVYKEKLRLRSYGPAKETSPIYVELKKKYNCLVIIDEAHAFGVFGENGLGVAEELKLIDDIDLIVGTFGKSVGSMGAFVTGSKILIDFLINKSRSFIFSTALPPINIAFSKWIIENKFPHTYTKRKRMLSIGKKFGSDSHIIPVVIGENKDTVDLCEILFHNGYFTLPIRPPTVPVGTSRIRLSLTCEIQEDELKILMEKIHEKLLVK